jgi:hypothetical protein
MAYLKPPAFTRHLANPLAMRVSARGVATLTVVGRRTGQPRKVPVIPGRDRAEPLPGLPVRRVRLGPQSPSGRHRRAEPQGAQ